LIRPFHQTFPGLDPLSAKSADVLVWPVSKTVGDCDSGRLKGTVRSNRRRDVLMSRYSRVAHTWRVCHVCDYRIGSIAKMEWPPKPETQPAPTFAAQICQVLTN
jgi:hypothetical protein